MNRKRRLFRPFQPAEKRANPSHAARAALEAIVKRTRHRRPGVSVRVCLALDAMPFSDARWLLSACRQVPGEIRFQIPEPDDSRAARLENALRADPRFSVLRTSSRKVLSAAGDPRTSATTENGSECLPAHPVAFDAVLGIRPSAPFNLEAAGVLVSLLAAASREGWVLILPEGGLDWSNPEFSRRMPVARTVALQEGRLLVAGKGVA